MSHSDNDHIAIVLSDPIKYRCNICMKSFRTKSHIKYHQTCVSKEYKFTCKCGKGFKAKIAYDRHIIKETGDRPHICSDCEKSFLTKPELNRHVVHVHQKNEFYQCPLCQRYFAWEQNLKSHLKGHSGLKKKKIKTKALEERKKAEKSKTSNKCYVCHLCACSYSRKAELTRHIKSSHSRVGYQCKICNTEFYRRDHLKRHNLSKRHIIRQQMLAKHL